MKTLLLIIKHDQFDFTFQKGKHIDKSLVTDNFLDNTANMSIHCVSKQSSITKSCRRQEVIDDKKFSLA